MVKRNTECSVYTISINNTEQFSLDWLYKNYMVVKWTIPIILQNQYDNIN